MTGAISTPRYNAEDFETASIRSAAPSYVSEAPSYHSTVAYVEAAPAYAPAAPRPGPRPSTSSGHAPRIFSPPTQRQTIGLPPVPSAPPQSMMNINNFRIPTLSTANAPAARHYRKVAERRVNQSMGQPLRRYGSTAQDQPIDRQNEASSSSSNSNTVARPLEDPYLVGEQAAAEARRERLARETGDDVLQREDKQWDWLLAQMKDWDERERNWNRWRREVDQSQRKKLFRRIGRLL